MTAWPTPSRYSWRNAPRPSRNVQEAWMLYTRTGMHVSLADLRTILWHAGVATCGNTSAWTRDPEHATDAARLYRCAA